RPGWLTAAAVTALQASPIPATWVTSLGKMRVISEKLVATAHRLMGAHGLRRDASASPRHPILQSEKGQSQRSITIGSYPSPVGHTRWTNRGQGTAAGTPVRSAGSAVTVSRCTVEMGVRLNCEGA